MAPMPRPEVLVVTIAVFLTAGGHPREELPLDLQVLDDRLEDPVRVLQLGPVVLEVAGPDARRVLGQVQRAGLQLLAGSRRAFLRQRAAVAGARRHHVQQRHLEALRHQVGRHLRAHGPGAQHDRLLDVALHGTPAAVAGCVAV